MHMQQLMLVPRENRDLEWLMASLQSAIQLEHATIPPYLCAYWSIKTDDSVSETTKTIAEWIGNIVLQEMLHMGLACNLLTAIGGTPNIYCAGFVPKYPGPLPGHVHPGLRVSLAGLAKDNANDPVIKKEVVQTFMQIELPEKGPIALTAAQPRKYKTIGEFYDAISQAFEDLQPAISLHRQMVTDLLPQPLTPIALLRDATAAIALIKTQGEGTDKSPLEDGGGDIMSDDDIAHYYRFAAIYYERRIKKDPTAPSGWSFTGDKLPFPKADELYLMAEVPPGGYAESTDIDSFYTGILKDLHYAWENGDARLLNHAIGSMDQLTNKAINLLKQGKKVGAGDGIIGPSFVFRP
jgi:hypothetical protein